MIQTLFGQKNEQTQKFLEDGTRIPVTVVSVLPSTVVQVKTAEAEGYAAVQVGFGHKKAAKQTKSTLGHLKKAGNNEVRTLREIRVVGSDTMPALGESLNLVETFTPGDIVQVTGISKGKGFAGGVKRYGFRGGPRTHGQSDRERAPGSIGQTTTPGRVYKGKRMAGNMGHEQVTVKNLLVVGVNGETQTVILKGLVPGFVGSTIKITKTGEMKKFVPLQKTAEELEAEAKAAKALEEEAAREAEKAAAEAEVATTAETVATVEEVSAEATAVVEEAPVSETTVTEAPVEEKTEEKSAEDTKTEEKK